MQLKYINLLLSSIILAGCVSSGNQSNPTSANDDTDAITPDSVSPRSGTRLIQFLAVGSNKTIYTGKGQKIGITETSNFGYLNEYRDRLKTGLNFKSGIGKSYKPALGEQATDHPAMVTGLAVGKNYGIAPNADLYPYLFKYVSDVADIDSHAKSNKLVAINASWKVGVVSHNKSSDSYTVSNLPINLLKLSSSEVTNLKNILIDIYKKDRNGPYCPNLKKLTADKISSAGSVNADLTTLKKASDLFCNNGHSSYMTNSYYYNILTPTFIDRVINDADNGVDRPIWVWAAGNGSADTSASLASAPGKIAELEQYWLSVVNVHANYRLSQSSSMCGKAKKYCLGAIGQYSVSVNENGKPRYASGTSAAAPQVTAGLAVIKEKFPTKTNTWTRMRMLATARHTTANGNRLKDKNGKAVTPDSNGLSDEFGHGIMRLDLATKPLGELSTLSGEQTLLQAKKTALITSHIKSPSAFGDAFTFGLSNIKTKVFDSMGASFDYNLSNSVSHKITAKSVFNTNSKNSVNPFSGNVKSTKVNYASKNVHPYSQKNDINFSYNINKDLTLSYVTNQKKTNTFQIDKKINKLNLSVGMIYEKGSFLGAELLGAFKTNALATTQYIKANYSTNIKGFDLTTSSVYGITQANNNSTMLNISKAHSFMSKLNIKKDNWSFGVNMPLRVIKAKGKLTYVNKISKGVGNNDKLHYTTKTINLKPSGNHITFNLIYKKNGWKTGFVYHKDKNHTINNNEKVIFTLYTTKF